jgi:hypothetical protein
MCPDILKYLSRLSGKAKVSRAISKAPFIPLLSTVPNYHFIGSSVKQPLDLFVKEKLQKPQNNHPQ